jgi:hypothetical protein
MAIPSAAHLAPPLDTQELRAAFVKFPTLCKAIHRPVTQLAIHPRPAISLAQLPALLLPTTYYPPPTPHPSLFTPWQAFEVKQRSVWAAMDDGKSEAEIFAIADKVHSSLLASKLVSGECVAVHRRQGTRPGRLLLATYSLLLTAYSSLLTPHSSLLTPHSSLLTPHSSLLTPHSSLLTPNSLQLLATHSLLTTYQGLRPGRHGRQR